MPAGPETRASCLYTGYVSHRRYAPVRHDFRYRLTLAYLDLEELAHLDGLAPLWGCERRAPVSFRRKDYFGDPRVSLDRSVRDLVEERSGARPRGPVRLLTCPRHFGYSFNPLSLYFCFDGSGSGLECVVAEVTNTPWLERHCYVLPVPAGRRRAKLQRFVCAKELHVSPFMDMQQDYLWKLTVPGERATVHIGNRRQGRRIFDASLSLRRVALRRTTLARSLLAAPLMPARMTAAIYFEAARLWWKGAPYVPHPRCRQTADQAERSVSKHDSENERQEACQSHGRDRAA